MPHFLNKSSHSFLAAAASSYLYMQTPRYLRATSMVSSIQLRKLSIFRPGKHDSSTSTSELANLQGKCIADSGFFLSKVSEMNPIINASCLR